MNISILHLSDLHIVAKDGSYSEILKNLISDVKEQCHYLKHIILVITGDIINEAKYTKENETAIINFFQDLKEEIGEKVIGVEIVPGNHDKEQDDINKELLKEKREQDEICHIGEKEWDYYLISYKKYLILMNRIREVFNKNSRHINNSFYVENIDMSDLKIIFINMDTAWSSYGGKTDKRKLCIDERQLYELKDVYQKEKKKDDKKCITIMTAHHSLNWLKEKDESTITPWMLNQEYFNIDCFLCGHTHDRQINTFFDTQKSYITLVTGIGWGEKTPLEEKNGHRYSIYNMNINNNYIEIIIRKTRADGKFDIDNDVLLTQEEKEDKKIYRPLNPLKARPKITIPVYGNNDIRNEYLFVDEKVMSDIKKITEMFYDVANHMSLFCAMHVKDFFVKYELNKSSKGTVVKQEIYDDYFYKNRQNDKIDELFTNIRNKKIIYDNFVAFLRELCGTVVTELADKFSYIRYARLHFRKYYKADDGNILYIAFCQAILGKESPPSIRDIRYEESMIKIAFDKQTSFVYTHNKAYNPLPMAKSPYDDFITMVMHSGANCYNYKDGRKNIVYPFISASLSIACSENSNLLDILNYLDIGGFIFKMVYDYVALFKIDMIKFIKNVEEQ